MRDKNFFGVLLVFLTCVAMFCIGYGFGRHKGEVSAAQKKQPVIKPTDPREVIGVVWYNQKDKVWRFMSGNGFDHSVHELSKTEALEEMAMHYQHQQRQDGRKIENDCSVAVRLQVRIANMPQEIMPGYSADYEVLSVRQMATDFCFHCEHALKAQKE